MSALVSRVLLIQYELILDFELGRIHSEAQTVIVSKTCTESLKSNTVTHFHSSLMRLNVQNSTRHASRAVLLKFVHFNISHN